MGLGIGNAYALIGCGRIAKNHVYAAAANNLDIAALCDVLPERARGYLSAQTGDAAVYTDYKEMLRAVKPGFVAIATESGNHAQIALDCINAGAHVLIEKPIALSVKDADDVIAAAKERRVTVGVCHQNRFNKSVEQLRRALDDGRFGHVYSIAAVIRWQRDRDYYEQAPWRGTWAQDGGCLMNQCIHNIDLLRWMGGGVSTVFGHTDNFLHHFIEAEDFGVAIVAFQNGAVGTIEGTVNIFPQNLEETLTVCGERGTVKIGGKSLNELLEWRFADDLDDGAAVMADCNESPPNVYGFGHARLYADFIAAVHEGREPLVSAQDGKAAMELVLALYKSARSVRVEKLPLENCATLDFAYFKKGEDEC